MVRGLIFAVLLVISVQAKRFRDPAVNLNNEMNSADRWEVKKFRVKLDHFNYADDGTLYIKLLWNNTFYKDGGPIFFYTGNEASIEGFANATGMIWDLAPMFNAAIIFAEHRYYGDSLPFGNESYSNISNLGFLTSEQALADYASLLYELKMPNNILNHTYSNDTPVIAFGGSYGGMLSAWLRVKYPHLVNGAWASSAPLIYFRGGKVDQGAFDAVTTNTYLEAGCNRHIVEKSWNAIINLSSTADGQDFLNNQFRIDPRSAIKSTKGGWNLNGYIREAIEYMAMVDYPYNTSFLEPLPGWPVKVACSFMNDTRTNFSDRELATKLYNAANVYYNTSGKLQYNCIDPAVCGDRATALLGDEVPWSWQECSEIVIDMCSKGGENDFFWNECSPSSIDFLAQVCESTLKRFNWTTANWNIDAVATLYGLTVQHASNIILTQGHLDPWSGGGYKASSPDNRNDQGIYVVEIPASAHHLDLRTPNTCDPNTVKNARYQIVQILKCWVGSCNTQYRMDKLPELKLAPEGTECHDVNGGYPWGQESASNVLTLYIIAIFTLLFQHLPF